MYQTSTEFLLEITRGYISIIKCKDPTHCIIRSNKHFIIRREHPTAQRSNTLHNKIQPTFSIYDVHQAISRCRLLREPYTEKQVWRPTSDSAMQLEIKTLVSRMDSSHPKLLLGKHASAMPQSTVKGD